MDLWRWTQGAGQILMTNSALRSVQVSLRLLVEGVQAGDAIEIACNGQHLQTAFISPDEAWTKPVVFTLSPGASILSLNPAPMNQRKTGHDPRKLGIGLHQLELRLLPTP